MSWSCIGDNDILVVPIVINDALYTRPRVLDVIKITPQVAVLNN